MLFVKKSFFKVSVSLSGFGPSVAHGKNSVRRRRAPVFKLRKTRQKFALLDAVGRRSRNRSGDLV